MSVNNNKATSIGDKILIKNENPYKYVKQINSYTDVTIGETLNSYFIKYYRLSINNITFSDWELLTNNSLNSLVLNSSNDLWIEYSYEVAEIESGVELEFKSINLDIVEDIELKESINSKNNISELSSPESVVNMENCDSTDNFKPYDLAEGKQVFEDMSCLVSNVFGQPATYYRSAPKTESTDVILKEYSLYNVLPGKKIKINVPGNTFPSREIQINVMGEEPEMFEVHIVISVFKSLFGINNKPGEGDFIHFENIDRMFEVNSISLPNTSLESPTFYKVNLTDYQDRKNRDFSTAQGVEEYINSKIDGIESVLGKEREKDIEHIRNPKQYNVIGTLDKDLIRSQLNTSLLINEEKIYNNYNIISKNYYKLNSVNKHDIALTYRYNKGLSLEDNRALMFWLRPDNIKTYSNISINSIVGDGSVAIINAPSHKLIENNIIRITSASEFNGLYYYNIIDDNTLSIVSSELSTYNGGVLLQYDNNKFIEYGDKFYVEVSKKSVTIKIDNELKIFDLKSSNIELSEDWYSFNINYSNTYKQLSLFIWKIENGVGTYNANSVFSKIYSKTQTISISHELEPNLNWNILGTNLDLTNIRLFRLPIEEEEQSLVMNRYIVKNSQYAEIIDNAIPQYTLQRTSNSK